MEAKTESPPCRALTRIQHCLEAAGCLLSNLNEPKKVRVGLIKYYKKEGKNPRSPTVKNIRQLAESIYDFRHPKESLDKNEASKREQFWNTYLADLQEISLGQFSGSQTRDSFCLAFIGLFVLDDVSSKLKHTLEALDTTSDIKESIRAVLDSDKFPHLMALPNRFVRNPVWNSATLHEEQRSTRLGPAAETSKVPPIMHADLLLIRRNDRFGRGEIYTYPSPAWKCPLIPFRHRLPQDSPDDRTKLNAEHLAKFWGISADSIKISVLPGKFLVSAKPNVEYRELYLYVFEMCSVLFTKDSEHLQKKFATEGAPWFTLSALRDGADTKAVNGDVIRALHELFTVTLGPLPESYRRFVA